MAKILVADDNSNVQKTVALALADLGVEVIAVNNGEAAVRKLADISPDLVLADIFMPVRNGYEVCEYVKKDARFSRLPVVLLVGAFDPLDEREAQRVGADGILKKPFVPPDPLITMVKTLLDRTLGDRLVAVGATRPAVSMQAKAGGVAAVEEHPAPPETSDELPVEEFRPPAERLSFGEEEAPIAFGQLLETPAQDSATSGSAAIEPVDDEQVLTSSRDASLGDPIFWRTEEPEPAPEEENSEVEEDVSSGIPMRPWKPDEEAASRQAESDFLQPLEPFELVREEQEANQNSTIVESSSLIAQDAASQASLTVEASKPEDLAANPIEWMASVPPPPEEETPDAAPDWSAALTEDIDTKGTDEESNLKSAPEPVVPESRAAVQAPLSAPAQPAAPPPAPTSSQPSLKPFVQDVEDTARSIPKQDWADLASSLQQKSMDSAPEKVRPLPGPVAATPSVTTTNAQPAPVNSEPPILKPFTQSTEDTARSIAKQDWADLAANLLPKPIEPVAEKSKPVPALLAKAPAAPPADAQPASAPVEQVLPAVPATTQLTTADSAASSSPDPALVEAVVQRVLDKMRPQVVDIITKEFLRPVVQALVHREIQKR